MDQDKVPEIEESIHTSKEDSSEDVEHLRENIKLD